MSRSTSAAAASIIKMYEELPLVEFEALYGVEVDTETGTVFDLTEDESFESIAEWATFVAELEADDNYGAFEGRGGRHYFDDEY